MRIGLMLDAAYNGQKLWKVDERRLYARTGERVPADRRHGVGSIQPRRRAGPKTERSGVVHDRGERAGHRVGQVVGGVERRGLAPPDGALRVGDADDDDVPGARHAEARDERFDHRHSDLEDLGQFDGRGPLGIAHAPEGGAS